MFWRWTRSPPVGNTCESAEDISGPLPINASGNTGDLDDNYDLNAPACGADSYIGGASNDMALLFTPTTSPKTSEPWRLQLRVWPC